MNKAPCDKGNNFFIEPIMMGAVSSIFEHACSISRISVKIGALPLLLFQFFHQYRELFVCPFGFFLQPFYFGNIPGHGDEIQEFSIGITHCVAGAVMPAPFPELCRTRYSVPPGV